MIDSVGLEVPSGEIDTVDLDQKLSGELSLSVLEFKSFCLRFLRRDTLRQSRLVEHQHSLMSG